MSEVRIYLSYHKDSERLKTDILTPIHVGRAIASEEARSRLSDIIGDDTGDNISAKNASYCELTAQYWAWKNTKSDYVGFFHYRRHLIFSDDNDKIENKYGTIDYPCISEDYIRQAGLIDVKILDKILGNDIVTVKKWDVSNVGSKGNYDHYKSSSPHLNIDDYDEMIKILLEFHPDYAKDVAAYNDSNLGYYTNIFVMKWEIFDEYCSFLFPILEKLESKIDLNGRNTQELRVFGYLSEWMFGIFITHQLRTTKRSVLELPRTLIQYVDVEHDVMDYCSITDDNYARHLGVFITSVKANKGEERIRHWIFSNGMSPKNKQKLMSLSDKDYSICIIEYDTSPLSGFLKKMQSTLKTNPHVSITSYYRLFVTDQLPGHVHRLLYLDCDMICRGSLAELYTTDYGNNAVCGVRDVLEESNTQRLNLKRYVNAGVLLINVDYWRENDVITQFEDYIITNVDTENALFYHDQDVINTVLNSNLMYLDSKWNAQTSPFAGSEEQNKAAETSVIVHYVSSRKPWLKDSECLFEDDYYHYFTKSPWSSESRYVGSVKTERKTVGNVYNDICTLITGRLGYSLVTAPFIYLDARLGNHNNLCVYYDKSYSNFELRSRMAFLIAEAGSKVGNQHAMIRVARAYKDAHGVEKDMKKSFEWFRKTIDAGADWARGEFEDNLPRFYDESYNVVDEAYWKSLFEELMKSAESGNPHAMIRVARAYKEGHGVKKNVLESGRWYSLAHKTQDNSDLR